MKKMNVIVVFDNKLENTLMCKRTKEPYMGMYNLVGGKIEKENDGLNEAYRELEEETNIKKKDIDLIHFMNLTYTKWNKEKKEANKKEMFHHFDKSITIYKT